MCLDEPPVFYRIPEQGLHRFSLIFNENPLRAVDLSGSTVARRLAFL